MAYSRQAFAHHPRAEHRRLAGAADQRLKGSRYAWLRNPENMDEERWEQFAELRDSALQTARAWGYKEVFHGGSSPEDSLFAIYSVGVMIFVIATALTCYVLHLRLGRTIQRIGAARVGSHRSPSGLGGSQDASAAVPVTGTFLSEADDAARHFLAPASASDAVSSVAPDAPAESSGVESRESRVTTAQLRLPPEIGRDIVYVHVSGHYVEVVTTVGTAVVQNYLAISYLSYPQEVCKRKGGAL